MRWWQKITGHLFVPTIWKFEDDRSLPAERALLHCQWIQINFQQLTHIGRCRKLERENDSTATRYLHSSERTCSYIQTLQLSSPPPIPTGEGTQRCWTRSRENFTALPWRVDPGCWRHGVAVGTLVRSFTSISSFILADYGTGPWKNTLDYGLLCSRPWKLEIPCYEASTVDKTSFNELRKMSAALSSDGCARSRAKARRWIKGKKQ
jgi:hypothetical protein